MNRLEAAAQIRSLRRQLDALEARLKFDPQAMQPTFADLRGLLQNDTPTTEEEIDAVKYRGKLKDFM